MARQPALIVSGPGIKRDGTRLEGDFYKDGEWCRFQRGRPRKIGGYQQVTDTVPEITRGITQFSQDDIQFVHLGHPNSVGQYQVSNGTLSTFTDRTPAGFVADVNNLWQFALFADISGSGNQLLIAHAAPNALNIDNSVGGDIYSGIVAGGAVLDSTAFNVAWNTGAGRPVSGGIVVSGQYLFAFGNDGLIIQSQINDLSAIPVLFNIGTQKIVVGKAIRGAGNGPAVLMWSLDSLIRGTFRDGGPPDFAFDILDDSISILSSQGVIEYDGVFYWPGIDRWYMFNGVVRELRNEFNDNWFFDNLNYTHRNKVFAMKVPRFGEIWWCYPRGNATECTHAVIFNVRGNFWYDTPLPDQDAIDQGRTAGINAEVYRRPFMVDNEVTANGRTLWQHETGVDKIRVSQVDAIRSFFETHEFNLLATGETTKSISLARIEPDFVQSGAMTCTVRGRQNAKAPITEVAAKPFPDVPASGDEETLKFKNIKRLMAFQFESNVQGGDYEYGNTYAHIEPADDRVES